MRKILILGKNGQVGWELQRTFATLGTVISLDRNEMNLKNPDQIRAKIREIRPDLILNAAAYTQVDKAESDKENAFAVNSTAVKVLAEEAKKVKSVLVHYSTDYVFDGMASTPYREDDATAPLNVYGASKLAGEKAIEEVGGKYLILRTSWVYGTRGNNFLRTMLRLAQEKNELRIVSDAFGAPTWSRFIAEATAQIIVKMGTKNTLWGTYHLTAQGQTSWHGFAENIFYWVAAKFQKETPHLIKILSAEYQSPVQRPMYSVLDNEKLFQTFGICLPDWKVGVQLCIEDLC